MSTTEKAKFFFLNVVVGFVGFLSGYALMSILMGTK